MKASYIDYRDTNSFSPAIIRYLENDPELEAFSNFSASLDGFSKFIKSKRNNSNRNVLVDTLTKQYSIEKQSLHPSVRRNIDLLLGKDTYTVTTGHQLNLFTGPLYFIFKIVTTINLAQELKSNFPDKNFVPLYWMATEDHDFAEINHTYIAGKKIEWTVPAAGATGRISTKEILTAVREYNNTLGVSENAKELGRLMHKAYTESSNLADATRFVVNSLFEEYGLVILDGDDRRLKKEFASVIQRDISERNSYKNISEINEKLKASGIEPQVNPREINFFYMKDELRERIVYEGGKYLVMNTGITFSADELREEITAHPERFSPNVVMRPLYQETILPNVAYIGGAAEVAYWLQLKQNFDFYRIDFPILLLRNSALITSSSLEGKLSRLDLGFNDIFTAAEDLKKKWVLNHTTHVLNLKKEMNELSEIFDKIKERASKIDPTLSPSSDAVKARLMRAMENLERKLIKAEKRNFSESLTQISSIKAKLFPNGALQERTENFGLFYVKYGKEFIRELITNLKPLDLKFTILEE